MRRSTYLYIYTLVCMKYRTDGTETDITGIFSRLSVSGHTTPVSIESLLKKSHCLIPKSPSFFHCFYSKFYFTLQS